MKRFHNQYGETQIGLILGALVIGCLSWGLFTLQGCIKEVKDARTHRYAETLKGKKKAPKYHKVSRSYKVKY